MKLLLTTTSLVFYSLVLVPCSWFPWSFCHTCILRPADAVISGVIVDTLPHAIRLQVLDVFRGTEQRDTITIWDGTDFDCNGIFPMDARGLGLNGRFGDTTLIGDTIVAVMPVIDSLENSWDVAGDYRRPDYFGYEPNLHVKHDTVRGYIAGPRFSADYAVWSIAYSAFKAYWLANNGDCSELVGVDTPQQRLKIYPTVTGDRFIIETDAPCYAASIFSASGVRLMRVEHMAEGNAVDIGSLPAGLYLAEVIAGERLLRIKVVKR